MCIDVPITVRDTPLQSPRICLVLEYCIEYSQMFVLVAVVILFNRNRLKRVYSDVDKGTRLQRPP